MSTKKSITSVAVMALLLSGGASGQNTSTTGLGNGNYISKDVFTSANGAASVRDVVYYDGLGYPVQEQSLDANTAHGRIVRPIVYDNMRRDDATVYLPFAAPSGSGIVEDAVSAQRAFYGMKFGDTDAYSFKAYEHSSVGRVLTAMREGHEYRQNGGHKSNFIYAVNIPEDAVKCFTYNYPSGGLLTGSVSISGCYPAASLAKVSSEDEDARRTDTYSTPRGLTVCTRTWLDSSDYLETHYVYDLKDSLVCVIQPEGMAQLGTVSNVAFSSDIARKYCFLYRYDGLGRIIESQVPGGGVSEYAYDERSRLVACASAEMAAHRLYRITRYDALDRVVSEYYAMLAEGTDAESLRLAMKTWDGSESALPAHTTVRRTYTASYYPFQIPESGPGGGSGNILPDPSNPTLEDFAQLDDEVFPEEEIVVDIVLEQSPLDFASNGLVRVSMVDTEHNRGMLMEETVSSVPGIDGTVQNSDTTSVTRRYYYDYRGNVIQMRELASDGWSATYSTRYDFAGNVTGTLESHTSPTRETHSVRTDLTLDSRGNVLSEKIYADGSLVSETGYSYDELMRPVGRTMTGRNGMELTESTEYDLRGWKKSSEVTRGNDEVFSESLSYMNPSHGVTPHWTGLISEATTMHFGNLPNTFQYEYDHAGRLLSAVSQRGSEDGIIYDANGNILSLERREITDHTTITDLAMSYDGNRLVALDQSGSLDAGPFALDYDANGNMTKDSRKRLQISHNVLNLPMIARDTVGNMTSTMTYTFLGDGTKVGARVRTIEQNVMSNGKAGKRYRGSFVYDVDDSGVQTLESIAVSTGRLIAVDTGLLINGNNGMLIEDVSFESDAFFTDHLGNVAAVVNISSGNYIVLPTPGGHHMNRPVFTGSLILEQNDYLPFGTRMPLKTQTTNRYRYAGKEEQDIAGMDLDLLDFGARYYDAFTCRWNAIDPLAHKYFGLSPYNYCGNDPVNKVDRFGLSPNEYYNENGELLLKTDNGDDVYIIRTSQSFENSSDENQKTAFSNSISNEEAQQTEESLRNGDLLGVNPKNLVKVASIKTLGKAAKAVKDNGHSYTRSNMKEYGGTIESDGSVIPAKAGVANSHHVDIPITKNTVAEFHSHQSFVPESNMRSSGYPSKADMKNTRLNGTTGYLFVPRDNLVLVYDGMGVHATFPLSLIK